MQRKIRFAMGLGMLLALSSAASATIPSEFTVQGVLRDGTGKLESQMVMVTLNFFTAQTGGTKLNSAAYGPTSVMAENGLFTQTVTLPPADLTALSGAAAVFLEMQVDTDTFPRQKVEPEMYALLCGNAQNAAQLGGTDASAYQTTATADGKYLTAALGNAAYAPATGSAAYAPATGSASYAPATGSASYEHAFSSGVPCATGQWVSDVNATTGAVTCSPIHSTSVTNTMLANSQLAVQVTFPLQTTASTISLGGTSTLSLDTTSGAGGQILHMTGPTTWAHTAIDYNIDAAVNNSTAGETKLCSTGAVCTGGRTVISGNCTSSSIIGVSLSQSFAGDTHTWCCSWISSGSANLQYTASANCL